MSVLRQVGPLLIGKGNVVSGAGGLLRTGRRAANLYQRLPAKDLGFTVHGHGLHAELG